MVFDIIDWQIQDFLVKVKTDNKEQGLSFQDLIQKHRTECIRLGVDLDDNGVVGKFKSLFSRTKI